MIKINNLEIENVKRVKAVRLESSQNGLTIASENQIQPNLLRNWKKEFIEKASIVFDDSHEENLKEKLTMERKEKAAYEKKVGQLTMQVDWLKKKYEELFGSDYESKYSPKPFED